MKLSDRFGRVLAIAPHPDDEILGCGGTLARLVDEGGEVTIAVATTGRQPIFAAEQVEQVQQEMRRAHAIIGVKDTRLLNLPAAELDAMPARECNAPFADLIDEMRPDTLLLPFVGDIHLDHQLTFLAAMVAARPRHAAAPCNILCYETVSETNWYAAPTTPCLRSQRVYRHCRHAGTQAGSLCSVCQPGSTVPRRAEPGNLARPCGGARIRGPSARGGSFHARALDFSSLRIARRAPRTR